MKIVHLSAVSALYKVIYATPHLCERHTLASCLVLYTKMVGIAWVYFIRPFTFI